MRSRNPYSEPNSMASTRRIALSLLSRSRRASLMETISLVAWRNQGFFKKSVFFEKNEKSAPIQDPE
jgi:hypothetical protein